MATKRVHKKKMRTNRFKSKSRRNKSLRRQYKLRVGWGEIQMSNVMTGGW